MNILKKIGLVNKILKAYKSLKEIKDNNKNYSNDVKDGFEMIKKGAEKIAVAIPRYKELYLDIAEALKNA